MMNNILKRYSFEGKDYFLVKGLDLQAYEVKEIDMSVFKQVEDKIKQIELDEAIIRIVNNAKALTIEEVEILQNIASNHEC